MEETQANHVQYQKDHIGDNKTSTIVGVYSLGFVLAVVAVGLRFLSRKISNLRYMADDWVILAALIIFAALFGVDIWHVVGGQLGKHAIRVTPEETTVFLQSLYVFNPLYTNIIPLCKISILLLYRRLFPLENVRKVIYILVGILVCFEISTTFVDIFGCHPLIAAWNKTIPHSHCVVPQTLYMATAGINLATDIAILIIPMPLVWRLHLSLKRKIAVSFIFILGSLVCVTTIFRIATFRNINSYDLTWSYIDTAYWTYSELCLSFVCACVPTFRSVLTHFTGNVNQVIQKSPLASSVNRFAGSKTSMTEGASKQQPASALGSLSLGRQGSKPTGSVDAIGLEEIEDPNAFETRAYFVPGREKATGERDGDLEVGRPIQGIHVERELHQTG